MKNTDFIEAGLKIEHSLRYEIRLLSGGGKGGPLGLASEGNDSFFGAIEEAIKSSEEIRSVTPVEIRLPDRGGSLNAFEADDETENVTIRVDLADDEDVLILSDCDGVLQWELPAYESPKGRALGMARSGQRLAVFACEIPGEETSSLGFSVELIFKPIKKLILRFVARRTAEMLRDYLERDIREGPLVLAKKSEGNFEWQPADHFRGLWDHDGKRPRRVLLFVHGTFSSTIGSFGGLAVTHNDAGRKFLSRVHGEYDAVIGFDHRTLAKSIRENGQDIMAALRGLPADEIEFDAIAFSRGGLVLRYLTEFIFPDEMPQYKLKQAVFVACTNNGTEFARPANWKDLVDLYTNLVAGAEKMLLMVVEPNTQAVSQIVSGLLKGALSFVRFLATETISENAIPGLASMEPDGDDVTFVNQVRVGGKLPSPADYHFVSADFRNSLVAAGISTGLPKRLFLEFADHLVDRLFKNVPNDLVVHQTSMGHLPESLIRKKHNFAATAGIYHTIYFSQPVVAEKLDEWLGSAAQPS